MPYKNMPAFYIKFKLKDGSIRWANEENGLVNVLIEATKYPTREAATNVASRLMGMPRVVKIPTLTKYYTKKELKMLEK